jgi:hypothetical protein
LLKTVETELSVSLVIAIHDSSIDSYPRDCWLISQLKLNRLVVQEGVLVKIIISKRVYIQLCSVAYRKNSMLLFKVN